MAHNEEPKAEASDENSDARAMEDFARVPSTMPQIGIDLTGFATEELAKSVGAAINSWLYAFGKILNLKRLKQVIVSYNYHEALAGIDRGAPVSGPLTATNGEIAVGIAMTPTVLQDGEPMSIMVLNAFHMAVFALDDKPEYAAVREQMIYTLAHECGHVHDLDLRASCLPEIILRSNCPSVTELFLLSRRAGFGIEPAPRVLEVVAQRAGRGRQISEGIVGIGIGQSAS
jgi:hypothetical protein